MRRFASPTAALAIAITTATAVACSPQKPNRVSAEAGAEQPADPAPRVLPAPTSIEDYRVEEGSIDNLGFTLAFRVQADAADAGKTFQQAAASCRARGRMLCSETQWLRACEQNPAVGRMESWTTTRRSKGVVVAGGQDCSSRENVQDPDTHPNRVGVCCERAVVLRSPRQGPLLGPGTRFPLRFENALNNKNDKELRAILANTIVRDGRTWTADKLIEEEKSARDAVRWTLFDTCDMRPGIVVEDKSEAGTKRIQGTLLTCKTVLDSGDRALEYVTILGLVGQDEASYRIAQIDHRGSALIPGAR